MTPTPQNPLSTLTRGAAMETLAAAYLQRQGLHLVVRNFRARCGEIDLICSNVALLVFVEVRQRTDIAYGGALASVTWRKQRRLTRTANVFLQSSPQWRAHRMRFDVIGIDGSEHRITWVRDAFHAR